MTAFIWAGRVFADEVEDRIPALMRDLPQPRATNFIRQWLVCGEFPNPPRPGQRLYDHKPPCVGCDTDYLVALGGEAAVRPTEGMTVERPDGSIAVWRTYVAEGDIIDLRKVYAGRPLENVLAYAYTTVQVAAEGTGFLAVGSDDGVKVWLNGELVHDHLVPRGVKRDQDVVPVTFRAGENHILLKVENGGGQWGYCCRVVESVAALADPSLFQPTLEGKPGAGEVTVKFWPTTGGFLPGPVRVQVVRPGGEILVERTTADAPSLSFETAAWPPGPCEVRVSLLPDTKWERVAHLPWFKGDPKGAVRRLLEAAAAAPEDIALERLAMLTRDRVGDGKRLNRDGVLKVHSELMEFEELQRQRKSQVGGKRPYGFVLLTYRSQVDNAPQYCRAYLPAHYDAARRWPLVVQLHGYNPDNPAYPKWPDVERRHHPWSERFDVIVLEPHARGNSWYRDLGEDDVLQVIQVAKEELAVDPDRVYLTGDSMGGAGVWEIGSHHPEVFAALAPVFGGWDDRLLVSEGERKSWTPRQRFRAAAYSSFSGIESLLTTPVFINHGIDDRFVNVNNARLAARMLQRWGYNLRYWEHDHGGHNAGGLGHETAMLEWLLRQRRQPVPRHVRLRAAEVRNASAHWLRVENREAPLQFIYADAELVAPNAVRLYTENALAVSMDITSPVFDRSRALHVDWNGRGFDLPPPLPGRALLRADEMAPSTADKRFARGGPIRDIFRTPFAIVTGESSADERLRKLCAYQANRIVNQWKEMYGRAPRRFTDLSVTEEQIRRWSLVLVGGVEANAVTRRFASELPLRIEGSTVRAGGKSFLFPDSQVRFICQHPENENGYLLVIESTSADAMFFHPRARDPRGFHLLDDMDYCVIDNRAPANAMQFDDVNRLSGWFGPHWEWREKDASTGDPTLRAHARLVKVPPYVSAIQDVDTLYLSDLLESAATGGFGDMTRDIAADGTPLRLGDRRYGNGLGVSVWRMWAKHSTAEWDIEGGGWRRLQARVGLQLDPEAAKDKGKRDRTKARIYIKGDGKELFKSEQLHADTPPVDVDVDLTDVKLLQLEVHNEAEPDAAAVSANFVDARLTKSPPEREDENGDAP